MPYHLDLYITNTNNYYHSINQEGESEEPEKAPEPTEFTVKLTGFSATAKIKLIKEIKAINPGMNLVQV